MMRNQASIVDASSNLMDLNHGTRHIKDILKASDEEDSESNESGSGHEEEFGLEGVEERVRSRSINNSLDH